VTVTNPTRMAQPATKQTLIEDDTEFKGKLSSKCPVVVKGTVDGEIAGPSLHVSARGSVSGQVKVTELRSEGTIGGEFDAETVHLAGTVKSNTVIRARSLEVKLAPQSGRLQVTFGECELSVGEVPTKEAAVSTASQKESTGGGKKDKDKDKEKEKEAAGQPSSQEIDAATDIREAAGGGDAEGGKRGRNRRDTSSPSPA
jgi:cytoskeletal protein CcmA (bactofilin family)